MQNTPQNIDNNVSIKPYNVFSMNVMLNNNIHDGMNVNTF